MSVIRWPNSMPAGGRFSEAKQAWSDGLFKVADPKMGCPRTSHISFDANDFGN
ncbi:MULTISPECIES: hypothetical protein [unclassified Paraburkholderia]|uniref:hypothetical protein n=1 Tax=unclassified Paraburkholderia TaxID=2615204 RepID=UPI002AB23FE8|nr:MULTISPECIES: hypothetical protein [unclassified Paraburkholderia]